MTTISQVPQPSKIVFGTEPLVRVYTEAVSPQARDAMVQAGEALVRAA